MRLIESFVTTSSTVQESGVNAEGSRFDLKKCDLNPGKLANVAHRTTQHNSLILYNNVERVASKSNAHLQLFAL